MPKVNISIACVLTATEESELRELGQRVAFCREEERGGQLMGLTNMVQTYVQQAFEAGCEYATLQVEVKASVLDKQLKRTCKQLGQRLLDLSAMK